MGAQRKKAVVSARCPPPPKHHHHRRTNLVRVQKHYAFHPNPRVPFAFHLREKAKLASSFLREQLSLSRVRKELYGHGANLYAKREKERNKRCVFANARSPLSLSIRARTRFVRSFRTSRSLERERNRERDTRRERRTMMNFNVFFFCARILWRRKRPQKRADDTRVHFGELYLSRAIKSATDAVLRTLSRGYLLYEHTSSLNNRVPKFFAGLRALKSCIVDSISFLRGAERLVVVDDASSWGVIKSADLDSRREKTQREREREKKRERE